MEIGQTPSGADGILHHAQKTQRSHAFPSTLCRGVARIFLTVVVLKSSADSTSLQNLRLGRDWAGLCCRSCPPTISARLSATPKTGTHAHGAVDTPIACHQGPVVARGLPHSRQRRDGRGHG